MPFPSSSYPIGNSASSFGGRYLRLRATTESLCRPLEPEDYVVQSMDDVSPTKWHLAHTSWFFETFLLRPLLPEYPIFHKEFEHLFNSYYNAVGPQFSRPHRGLLSRPTVREVYAYRHHVDEHMLRLLETLDRAATHDEQKPHLSSPRAGKGPCAALDSHAPHKIIAQRTILGMHHEQQHQELMLMDIKHVFSVNPLRPAFRSDTRPAPDHPAPPLRWHPGTEGVHHIGFAGAGVDRGFCFDNETPRHRVFVQPFLLASRCVTNAEYLAFVQDGGYTRSDLWLSDGWAAIQAGRLRAPLYWLQATGARNGAWHEFTLRGLEPLAPHVPVVHVSHYEADAFARWAGARLATEIEWELMADSVSSLSHEEGDSSAGNCMESSHFHPVVAPAAAQPRADDPTGTTRPAQMFGDVWEWTASAYLPYPGFRPAAGALGEYNGKFMSGQMVLRGGSCATPASHIRATYRNFFPPGAQWSFTGIRLARDA